MPTSPPHPRVTPAPAVSADLGPVARSEASGTAENPRLDEDAGETPDEHLPRDEERLLSQVTARLSTGAGAIVHDGRRYDAELVALRDEIGEARLEDVPALVAQMERLQGISARRAEAEGMLVDPQSPYFAHMRLRERHAGSDVRERDVMIGRATFVDARAGVRIVDWRHAPVSQLYYRYAEGSPYEERFGDREVEGEVLVRRTVTIEDGRLLRVAAPQGTFVRSNGSWTRFDARSATLAGGQGKATRPVPFSRGVLGTGPAGEQRLDRHLPEIAALIDPRQFELITAPESGLVVIQGGAGSGKTTIGLHRMAYLAYAAPNRFTPSRMRVVTHGAALAAYIGQVLPALGVHGVPVITFRAFAEKEIRHVLPWLNLPLDDDAPSVVSRMKKHPALLRELEKRAGAFTGRPTSRAVVELWADVLSDLGLLLSAVGTATSAPMRADEIRRAHQYCAPRVSAVLEQDPRERAERAGDEPPDDDDVRGAVGIDGLSTEDERARLDTEDLPLLLRISQIVRGPRRSAKKSALLSHLFVDEAQDLSPTELAVLVAETTPERSITLAGDTSQRLFLENGFTDWRTVLSYMSLPRVEIEPLRIAYRSTREILEVARYAMGPLADPIAPLAPRGGAPVEAHQFPGTGAAVAFLGEALRPLFAREQRATVALLARHPEQADLYYEGLSRAEVPYLRRVRAQDFSFRPGVEVTDIRQVKGLEFDYVVMLEVNAATFPADEESRHLFHIGATRAAHQLWLIVTSPSPSPLIAPHLLAEPGG
jgi:DNA helicase-2/ATP-dependent DNA helicase PcrA